jgi:hypothetical protein
MAVAWRGGKLGPNCQKSAKIKNCHGMQHHLSCNIASTTFACLRFASNGTSAFVLTFFVVAIPSNGA